MSLSAPFGDLSSRRDQPDVLCLSHLRWDFVFQRPQHLLTRAAREHRVFYVEEPVVIDGAARLDIRATSEGVQVVVPRLPRSLADRTTDAAAPPCFTSRAAEDALRVLLDTLIAQHDIRRFVLWYYTPMALGFSRHLQPAATVYDVMDELSLFRFAPPALLEREAELYRRADVVFTGGRSLYEAKRHRHANVHLFPSSVDVAHFAQARAGGEDPADQAGIPYPRIGFYGVIDERLNLDLVAELADARPEWHLVLVGPVVKIDPSALPRRANIHYLGGKSYAELPGYAAGWDVAMMPWALNDSTRFISPTKTPEYLAAGRPVVSTAVADVVHTYADEGLVRIADSATEFEAAIEAALAESPAERAAWLARADAFLARGSWDRTWARMRAEIEEVLPQERAVRSRPAAASHQKVPLLADLASVGGQLETAE